MSFISCKSHILCNFASKNNKSSTHKTGYFRYLLSTHEIRRKAIKEQKEKNKIIVIY